MLGNFPRFQLVDGSPGNDPFRQDGQAQLFLQRAGDGTPRCMCQYVHVTGKEGLPRHDPFAADCSERFFQDYGGRAGNRAAFHERVRAPCCTDQPGAGLWMKITDQRIGGPVRGFGGSRKETS